jgi:Zn-finger nucleic acid-binding protein
MAEVAVCPNCEGERKKYNARSGQMEDCPTCHGKGVVWRDGTEEAVQGLPGEDNLNLEYRRE